MRKVFENVIEKGGYDLTTMLARIDSYHISGKLTDADRDALYGMARAKAQTVDSIDIYAKLAELEERVRKLENGNATAPTKAAEYVAGKWYYAGDMVTFKGETYTCVAPEGVVCTWSPEDYPVYWNK